VESFEDAETDSIGMAADKDTFASSNPPVFGSISDFSFNGLQQQVHLAASAHKKQPAVSNTGKNKDGTVKFRVGNIVHESGDIEVTGPKILKLVEDNEKKKIRRKQRL